MGRMLDIMRSADRRPAAVSAPAPVVDDEVEADDETPLAVAASPPITEPALEDDNDVPFIEVGGPREPTLRLVPAPEAESEKNLTPQPPSLRGKGEPEVISLESSPPFPLREGGQGGLGLAAPGPTLFTIRFQPVHAARIGGRGPVAELIAFHQPDHPVSVQYRSLAAEIARQLPGPLPRVLLFAGAAGGVGTSTVLLNLAVTLARQETKVTVADAHLARPVLAERLGLPAGPGWREVLAGQMPAAWCLQETAQSNLLVLPAGVVGEPRDGTGVGTVIEMLRDRSDCVLLDAGPWADSATDLAVGSDAVYLVLWQESTDSPESAAIQEEILAETGRLRGCVLTQK